MKKTETELTIVGGGISGLVAAYEASKRGVNWRLLEASERLGGIVETRYRSEGVVEIGADSFLAKSSHLQDLIDELGLSEEKVGTLPSTAGSYIVRDSKLHPVPEGMRLMVPTNLVTFGLRSGLVSLGGKLRALADMVLPAGSLGKDISLGEMVRQRLGTEILNYVAQPMAAGIYGSDPDLLSVRATMPYFYEALQEHKSLILGLRKNASGASSRGARYKMFVNFKRGSQQLLDALKQRLDTERLSLDTKVEEIAWEKDNFEISTSRERWRSRHLMLALPGPALLPLLDGLSPKLHRLVEGVPYHDAATINFLLPADKQRYPLPPGYGFVLPSSEPYSIIACTFTHQKYPERMKEDYYLVRAYLGGYARQDIFELDDKELVRRSWRDLCSLLKWSDQEGPLDSILARIPRSMPQYQVGHLDRVERAKELMREDFSGHLQIIGNCFEGIGVPDRIAHATRAVEQMEQKEKEILSR